MVTPNEKVVLEIIAEEGGETTVWKLSSKMGMSTHILDSTCKSLKRRGYIEFYPLRKVTITGKGLHAIGKRPLVWRFPADL